MKRCDWVNIQEPIYIDYHDYEWGVPITDDQQLFELLSLEGAQAGLNWLTILKRREGYRTVFEQFDIEKVAMMNEQNIEEMTIDSRIIRHRGKIASVVHNAKCVQAIQQEYGSFASYVWSWVEGKQIINDWSNLKKVPVTTPISDAFSKDLKKRGFKFVGSTTIYAFMQAAGLVWDHVQTCDCKIKHNINVFQKN